MAKLMNIVKEEDPCWKGYQQVGMKTKNGKQVPNCVPEGVINEVKPQFIKVQDKHQAVVNGAMNHMDSFVKKIQKGVKNGEKFEISAIVKMRNILDAIEKYGIKESVNESSLSDIDIIAQEAKDFRDFVKEFYKEYKDFPKTKESMKWLEGIYKNRSKMEGLDKDGLERVASALPQTEEEPVNEDLRMGFRHIIHLIPTGYAPNDPKYKADLKYLRNTLNNFYKERGYDRTILPIY
jgi:hypothetical protein